ncbi:MAG: hypothetical protein DRP02_11905 [Candidatus Gerdarchaeota archaeon]|nr:MAG: hypothetical protein DRP02_11905 [Candidatus Gerdarchaeota archaeon]
MKLFKEAIEKFKEQFGVELEPVGHRSYDGVFEKDYKVKGLVESKTEALQILVTARFTYDSVTEAINCIVTVDINGEDLAPLRSWWRQEQGKWIELYQEYCPT